MAGYHGGQAVKEGIYLSRFTWKFESIGREGGILPGDKATHYVRVPLPAVMVVGPLTGLAYIIVLPTVFCLVFIYSLGRWLGRALKISREEVPVGLRKTMTSK